MDEAESSKPKFVSIKDYYLYELAAVYGISIYLMQNRIKEHEEKIKIKKGRTPYSPEQVELIFKLVRLPNNVKVFRA